MGFAKAQKIRDRLEKKGFICRTELYADGTFHLFYGRAGWNADDHGHFAWTKQGKLDYHRKPGAEKGWNYLGHRWSFPKPWRKRRNNEGS